MSRSWIDFGLLWSLRACAALAGMLVVLVMLFLVVESAPALWHVGWRSFFQDTSWHPTAIDGKAQFGLLPMLAATLATTVGALMLATPLGIGSALFAHYYAPSFLGRAYGKVIELLAGIPSVVYGLWGLVVLVPLIARWQPPGTSLLSAILILTLMVIPTIALLAGAALENVPREYLQGAAALGFSRSRTLLSVVLPAARSGLITALLLGTGRAIGETMAVLMVSGNVVQMPHSLTAPVRTLTANIALEMAYAMDDHRSALFVAGLVLTIFILLLVGAAEIICRGRIHG